MKTKRTLSESAITGIKFLLALIGLSLIVGISLIGLLLWLYLLYGWGT